VCIAYCLVFNAFLFKRVVDRSSALTFSSLSTDIGFGGYYKGLRTKIAQSILATSLLLVCKEKITEFTRDVLNPKRDVE